MHGSQKGEWARVICTSTSHQALHRPSARPDHDVTKERRAGRAKSPTPGRQDGRRDLAITVCRFLGKCGQSGLLAGSVTPSSGRASRSPAALAREQLIDANANSEALALPDLAVGAAVVRDVELALLGVLPSGQLLGGAIVAPATEPAKSLPGLVRIGAPEQIARSAVASGGLVLRDEESTPLARVSGIEHAGTRAPGSQPVIQGLISPLRAREGGEARAFALSGPDLFPPATKRAVVVFGRPPVSGDAEPIWTLLDRAPGQVLAVVPDSPQSDIPTAVMLRIAQRWIADAGLDTRGQVRTAPLAWRDPGSDDRLVGLLSQALGATTTLHLAPGEGSPAGREWARTRAALESGDGTGLDALTPAIAALLRGWRPDRASRGLVVMFTGLSGSGKSTVARDLTDWVRAHSERTVTLLDGDVVRTMLSSGLGFDRPSRELNVARIGYVAAEIARHGGIAICAPIAPYAATRTAVREMVQQVGDLVLVHVSTPIEECERRDLKGLYAKARAGLVPEFTGISDPYEEPVDADLAIDTSVLARDAALCAVLRHLRDGGWIRP